MTFNMKMLPERIQKGMGLLAAYGYIQLDDSGFLVEAVPGNQIILEKKENSVIITYDTEPHFYMALARSIGVADGIHHIVPKAKDLGLMLDCSRNAVPTVDMVKQLISLLVLTGYNYLELYTEETYELPDEPYFGYNRGRFTADELKEIVAFADQFHFEMVPCIQVLAHLSNLSVWMDYLDFMDTRDTLLVGDERTYDLIRKCIRFWKEICHTKRINIGTDEAFNLGRGKYTDRYGYKPKHEVYLEHLNKVFEICREEGMEPEFWADAFYHTESKTEDIQKIFDGTQTPIYYSYGIKDVKNHCDMIKRLREYAGKVMFCGGLWKWIGYIPDNKTSICAMDKALEATVACGIDNVMMSAWGDDGNECSVYSVMPSLWHAAEIIFPCDADISTIIHSMTGYTSEEWMTCDKMNYMIKDCKKYSNAAKWLLHNDFLIGMVDYHVPDYAGDWYKEWLPELEALAERDSRYAYIFRVYATLCRTLIYKATYGKRLYQAYHKKDIDTMRSMVDELYVIKENLQAFYQAFRVLWLKENKGTGFEVMDVRIGGLIARISTVTVILNDYLAGHTEKIYELEGERLDLHCWETLVGEEIYAPQLGYWRDIYSANHIA